MKYSNKEQNKKRRKVPSQEVVEVVLILVLFTFTPNTSYAYFLNVESYNLVVLKSYNTEFDKLIITFTN